MPREFGDLLDDALCVLRRDVPAAYERVASLLSATPVQFDVDHDRRVLSFAGREHQLAPSSESPAVRVDTDSRTIVELMEARLSLLDALRANRLELRGPASAVAYFDDALGAFLAGAVRTRETAGLFDELRAKVENQEEKT